VLPALIQERLPPAQGPGGAKELGPGIVEFPAQSGFVMPAFVSPRTADTFSRNNRTLNTIFLKLTPGSSSDLATLLVFFSDSVLLAGPRRRRGC